jgi:hypothetical protein
LCLFQLNFEDNVLQPPKLMTTKHLPGLKDVVVSVVVVVVVAVVVVVVVVGSSSR